MRSSRHPHEIMILVSSLFIGVTGLIFFDSISGTTVKAFPAPYGKILLAGTAAGSLVSLIAVCFKGITAVLIERAGLITLGGFLGTYATVSVAVFGVRGFSFAFFVGGIAIANFWRAKQIPREIREKAEIARILDARTDHREAG